MRSTPIKTVLCIGATSAIVTAAARRFAADGAHLYLVARSEEKLERLAADLTARGAASVQFATFDAENPASHAAVIATALAALPALDAAIVGHGVLPNQDEAERSWSSCESALTTNFLSPIACILPLAEYFQRRGAGNITVLSSVAGDRGRQSNYIYGSAKGGLSVFLQGLRNRLAHHGVSVTTIKPGFVDTPMTAHLRKGPLFASAEQVGSRIYRAMIKHEREVYSPSFWRVIMFIIKSIPERIFMRLRL